MYIYKLDYKEYPNNKTHNSWSVDDLCFRDFNLIVGQNATGKTRTIYLLKNLAAIIKAQQVGLDEAQWEIEFKKSISDKKIYIKYNLEIHDREVIKEELQIDGELKLQRSKNKAKLYSENTKDFIEIAPPNNRLALHVRRDKKEFPYFELLVNWAENLNTFTFATRSTEIKIPRDENNVDATLAGLEAVPSILDKLDETQKENIIKELNEIGYAIESLKTIQKGGVPIKIPLVEFKEKGISHAFDQLMTSQGMFRTFALLVMVEYFQQQSKDAVILVDDLCEGLDYERSANLTSLLLKKVVSSKMQFIATTNDEFLMNEVPFEHWNILKRTRGKVKAFNYENSKQVFDEMKLTGFSNFNIFSSNLIDKLK